MNCNLFKFFNYLHLNVYLRDYSSDILRNCENLIVDDWEEVCRENTNIERVNKEHGIKKDNVL